MIPTRENMRELLSNYRIKKNGIEICNFENPYVFLQSYVFIDDAAAMKTL